MMAWHALMRCYDDMLWWHAPADVEGEGEEGGGGGVDMPYQKQEPHTLDVGKKYMILH